MTAVIHKFIMGAGTCDVQLNMPLGAKPLCVQEQNGSMVMWALVDPGNHLTPRSFFITGTGWPLTIPNERLSYIGTVQLGAFVWHLFEVLS